MRPRHHPGYPPPPPSTRESSPKPLPRLHAPSPGFRLQAGARAPPPAREISPKPAPPSPPPIPWISPTGGDTTTTPGAIPPPVVNRPDRPPRSPCARRSTTTSFATVLAASRIRSTREDPHHVGQT